LVISSISLTRKSNKTAVALRNQLQAKIPCVLIESAVVGGGVCLSNLRVPLTKEY
jgi:hypothetical protein